jgi:hypothetical protein
MRVKTLLTIGAITVFSFSAVADDGHDNNNNGNSFQSSVIGSLPGAVIGGIPSGGAPWVVKQGQASISGNRIHVQVQGLLLTTIGTTGTVTMVAATLVCGGSGGAVVPVAVAVTPSPLSSSGNADIDQAVTLPTACFGPVVLVQVFDMPTAQLSPVFIAVTGLTPSAAQNSNEDRSDHGDGGHGN